MLPEVGVTEVTVYELAETDRRISADLELDIREAPLREWEMEIPADHAVASVTGSEVADYAVASEIKDGYRTLKIIFKQRPGGSFQHIISFAQLVVFMLNIREQLLKL